MGVGFTHSFRSPTAWETLDRDTLQYRLLLALYGLGTGAGLKRVQMGNQEVAYKDLLYVRRRFITTDALRQAISAWDENLMTEWHVRYGGPVIKIYWHVDRKSACIHSQLKRCSSSEVAAMIEGVLRHCTDMEVERQYG